jgi:acetyl esterase/lipase
MDRRLFLVSGAAALAGRDALAETATTLRYGADARLQSLDFYPAAKAPAPLVVFIHGGGWRIGDKATAGAGRDKAAAFTARGFAYASLNYRLSPAVAHPAHVEDVAAGIAHLHRATPTLGIDRTRIFVIGHSAGAHLAALVAVDARRLGAHGLPLSTLKGVILLDGAGYDVTAQMRALEQSQGFTAEMYRDAFGTDAAGWADASPTTHIGAGTGIAPHLIVHTDRPAAVRQSRLLASRLRAAGVEADLFRASGYSHADVNRRIGQSEEKVTKAIFAALRRWDG